MIEQHRGHLPAPSEAEEEEQGERRHKGIEELRHVLAEIALQLIHALDALLHQLRRGNMLPVAGPQAQKLRVDLLPHHPLDRARGEITHPRGILRREEAEDHSRQDDQRGKEQISPLPCPVVQILHRGRDGDDHHGVQAQLQKLQEDVPDDVLSALGTHLHQALVKHRHTPIRSVPAQDLSAMIPRFPLILIPF